MNDFTSEPTCNELTPEHGLLFQALQFVEQNVDLHIHDLNVFAPRSPEKECMSCGSQFS